MEERKGVIDRRQDNIDALALRYDDKHTPLNNCKVLKHTSNIGTKNVPLKPVYRHFYNV